MNKLPFFDVFDSHVFPITVLIKFTNHSSKQMLKGPNSQIIVMELISEYPAEETGEHVFKVKRPGILSRVKYFALIIAGLFPLAIFPWAVGLGIIAVILSYLFTARIYSKVGQGLVEKNVVQALKSYRKEKEKPNPEKVISEGINSIIGLKFDTKKNYYVEDQVVDLNMDDVPTILKGRVFDIISASLGITFIFGMILTSVMEVNEDSIGGIFGIMLIFNFFGPLIVSWLIPMVWILEDTDIRVVDDKHQIVQIGQQLRSGLFSKLLGVGGLMLGVTFLSSNATIFMEEENPSIVGIYGISMILVFLFMLMIASPSMAVALSYLEHHHEKNVVACRTLLREILPTGLTIVKRTRIPKSIEEIERDEQARVQAGAEANPPTEI